MTVLNGTSQPTQLDWNRYAELTSGKTTAKDILTGKTYAIGENTELEPRATLVLEF